MHKLSILEYGSIDYPKELILEKFMVTLVYFYHYWCFLQRNFKFQPEGYRGCYDLIQKALSITDAATVSSNENVYRTHFGI